MNTYPYANGFTQEELDEFKKLKNIKVVIDIGAKDNVEYLQAKPKAEYHLFEPYPIYFEKLKQNVLAGGWKNIYLNECGVSDTSIELGYNVNSNSFDGSDATPNSNTDLRLPLISLDGYIKKHKITRIDFLKLDTEGMDYRILKGNPKARKLARYIQYEVWNNDAVFKELLSEEFDIKDIGYRNFLCKRKNK